MLLWEEKTLALFSLLLATLLSTCLAYKLRHLTGSLGNKTQIAVNALHCFGGGVFLGVLLLHLLPEVRYLAIMADMQPNGYPVAELFTSAGFFLILLIDQSMTACSAEDQAAQHTDKATKGLNREDDSLSEESEDNNRAVTGYGAVKLTEKTTDPAQKDLEKKTHLSIFVLAMSIHSIFEGLAMGLQPYSVELWTLYAAVITHKCPISFSLGLYMTSALGNKWRSFLCTAVIFSVMSPIGVAIGTVIVYFNNGGETDDSLMIVMVVLQGLASGTFLYVAFFEILVPNIRNGRGHKLVNYLSVFVGFTIMALVRIMHSEHGVTLVIEPTQTDSEDIQS